MPKTKLTSPLTHWLLANAKTATKVEMILMEYMVFDCFGFLIYVWCSENKIEKRIRESRQKTFRSEFNFLIGILFQWRYSKQFFHLMKNLLSSRKQFSCVHQKRSAMASDNALLTIKVRVRMERMFREKITSNFFNIV